MVAPEGATDTASVPLLPSPCPGDTADYRGDHHALLRPVGPADRTDPAAPGPDAIVIPIARSLRLQLPGLELGHRLATALDIPLVLQCSRDARPVDLDPSFLTGRTEVLDVDSAKMAWRRRFAAHRHSLSVLHRSNDVGPKRSDALLLAARRGWKQVLFLDDDVRAAPRGESPTLDSASLAGASLALAADRDLKVVGWTSDDFPDNSVYGHARRLLGETQTVFIGSGALLVPVDGDTPFFPDIYNEDWLFMIESARRAADPARAFGLAGGVGQLRYWPFRIERARSEEAGDLLGEALMNLLEDAPAELGDVACTKEFWHRALLARRQRLADARRALDKAPPGPGSSARERQDANTALLAAEGVRAMVPAYALAEYYGLWQEDLAVWRELLAGALQAGAGALTPS